MEIVIIIHFILVWVYLLYTLLTVSKYNRLFSRITKAEKLLSLKQVTAKSFSAFKRKMTQESIKVRRTLFIGLTLILFIHIILMVGLDGTVESVIFPLINYVSFLLFSLLALWIRGSSVLDNNLRFPDTSSY